LFGSLEAVLLAQKSAEAVPLLERVPALQAEVNKVLRATSATVIRCRMAWWSCAF